MNPAPSQQTSKLFTLTSKALLVAAFSVGVIGCQDKAKAKYDECVALESKWDTVKARDACKAASEISPTSKCGKLATGKLTYLNEQADKILAEKAKKEAPCTVGKWVTHCKWKDKPRPGLLEAATFARCNTDADEMRIVGMTCPVCECADRYVDPYKTD